MRRGVGAVAAAVAVALSTGAASAATPAVPADAFTDSVGVNTHSMYLDTTYEDQPRTIRALQWLGVRHVRDGVRWPRPRKTAWWRAEQRARLLALHRAGMRLSLVVGGPTDASRGSLAERLRVVRGLRGVVALEGPNEWDLSGDRGWRRTLPAMQRELHAAVRGDRVLRGRGVQVIGPSLGRNGRYAELGDLSDAMDLGNVHVYTGGRQPETRETPGAFALADGGLDAVRVTTGDRPIVVTETGFHDAFAQLGRQPPTAPRPAAAYLLRTVLQHAALGIRRTYVYELLDERRDPVGLDQEANFGLFDHRFRPKPAATALRNLLRVARDSGRSPSSARLDLAVEGGDGTVRSLLLAKAGGRYALALWRAVPVWDPEQRREQDVAAVPVRVRLPRRFAVARTYRPVRSAAPRQVTRDTARVDVAVDGEPVVVELAGAERPAASGRGVRPLVLALAPLRDLGGRW